MSYLAQQILALGVPGSGAFRPALRAIKIKALERCNLQCVTCSSWKRPHPPELSTPQIVVLIDSARAMGCERLHLSGGEVLLRGDVIELVEHASSLGLRTNLTTNGTLVDRGVARDLVRAKARWVAVSIDSPKPSVHDRVRGRKGAFRSAVAGIDRLLRAGARVRVNTVVSRLSWRSLVEMPEWLAAHPVRDWLLLPVDPRSPLDPSVLSAHEIAQYNVQVAPRLREAISLPGLDPFVFGIHPDEIAACARQHYARGFWDRHHCLVPWVHCFVDAAGDVFPCCMAHRRLEPVGNVHTQALSEIFLGTRFGEFRSALLRGPFEFCRGCDDHVRTMQSVAEARAAERLQARA
jgi:MoaA/NifB/PqqE/SkfB family radical SAM enzyme